MKSLIKRVSLLLAAAVVTTTVAGASLASAQSTGTNANGIKVSPVRTDLTINPGETKTVTVTVQNITTVDSTFHAIINDFVAGNNENGQPALILDEKEFAPSHSLKRFISPVTDVPIPANSSKDIKVKITVPGNAAAGGYYGAIRFVPAGSPDPNKNVSLAASVGSLMLVKVPGDVKENLTLESFDVRTSEQAESGSSFFASNKNLYAVARFKNVGNVHEQPFGKVQLKKGDKVLQVVEINNADPRGNVLPDSTRRFSAKLDKVGLWGKYTVEGNFGYGANGQLLSGKSTFYVVPLAFIIGVIVVIALIVAAVLWLPKAIKRYNQNVVRKASRK